jgi:chorismate mutase
MNSHVNLNCFAFSYKHFLPGASNRKMLDRGWACHLFILVFLTALCHASYAKALESSSTERLINLLNQRFTLIEQVAANKRENIGSIYDANREIQVLENAKCEAELNHLDIQKMLQFTQIMMDVSKQLEYAYIMHWQAKRVTPKVKYSLTQLRGKLLAVDAEISAQVKELTKHKGTLNFNSQFYVQAIKLPSSLRLYQSMLLSSLNQVVIPMIPQDATFEVS